MLEIELKLVPFVRDCYGSLSPSLKARYVEMLDEEDWQIFDWLQGRERPEDPEMADLMDRIVAHAGRL